MCGIFAYAGKSDAAAQIVLEGLKRLEYRGYDSWGIAVPWEGRAMIDRYVGKIGGATTTLPAADVALGHTRWATHGGVTRRNAHPHVDCKGQLAIIHNGIIENHENLRSDLLERGHRFRSRTDTEVVAHLVEEGMARGLNLIDATMEAFRLLDGLNAVAILNVATGEVAAAKSGSPIVLGWAEEGHLMASDATALLPHTRKVTFLDDGQAALLSKETIRIYDVASGAETQPRVEEVSYSEVDDSRGDHPSYMVKEIREQPSVLRRLAAAEGRLGELSQELSQARELLLTGCGSAFHAALAGTYFLSRVAGRTTNIVAASELPYRPSALNEGQWLVAVSQSGETIDVLDAVRAARSRGARVAAITNSEGSSLYRLADIPVLIGAGPERCVLATKTFTGQVATLALLAYQMAGREEEGRMGLGRAAQACEAVIADQTRILGLAARIHQSSRLLVLGRGPSYPGALEAALKVKEVSYLHAEGFAGGELKHGVIALVESGTPCLILAPRDETFAATASAAMEVKARGAFTIAFSPGENPAFDARLDIPDCGELAVLPQAVAGQLLAYHLALLRGCDPDKPRNLAKCVTVR